MWKDYEKYDFHITLKVENDLLELNHRKRMTNLGHNLKMMVGLTVVFLIGALSAYHNGFNAANIIDMLVAGLVAVEHGINGNTGNL